jgi:hypothetical protein
MRVFFISEMFLFDVGGGQELEAEDARKGASQNGQNRHRLPEAARRLFQVPNKAPDGHSRRSLLRSKHSSTFISSITFFGCSLIFFFQVKYIYIYILIEQTF